MAISSIVHSVSFFSSSVFMSVCHSWKFEIVIRERLTIKTKQQLQQQKANDVLKLFARFVLYCSSYNNNNNKSVLCESANTILTK